MSLTQLPVLPYSRSALAPNISENTVSVHYDKHHRGYLNKLNELLTPEESSRVSLEKVIKNSHANENKIAIFNNASQVWNHSFYWHSMTPTTTKPSSRLAEMIERSFGSLEKLREEFKANGMSQFGSGWVWLIKDNDKLVVTRTGNANLPLVEGKKALFCMDVWEHAYYLDVQNRRADYIDQFFELVNWDFAEENLDESNEDFFKRQVDASSGS